MPRRFFRKFAIKRHELGDGWLLSPFQHLLSDNRLWGIRRRTVVPALALGLFIAFLPFPGHVLMSVLLALALRINIPVAVLASFVSNPLTMGPMYYFAHNLGETLLDTPHVAFNFELSLSWVGDTFVRIWQPLMLGCLLLGTSAAIIGYVVVDLLWRSSVHDYKKRKRKERDSPR
jgi:uncharacterized protein (DUF2062 family)